MSNKSASLPVRVQGQILAELLSSKDETALNWAIRNIESRRQNETKAIVSAANMLIYSPSLFWQHFAQLFSADAEFCKRTFLEVASTPFSLGEISSTLSDAQLADLFIWLSANFPATKKQGDVVSLLGPEEFVSDFASRLPHVLSARATVSSITALEKIIAAMPAMIDVQRLIVVTRQNLATRDWMPFEPRTLSRLLNDHRIRVVQSADQLLEVIVQLLAEYQKDLRSESALTFALWNEGAPQERVKESHPKDEIRLSQQVAYALKGKVQNVVINCEVEVRVREEPDINVDAIVPLANGATEKVTAYIEVKGLWHQDVTTSMKSQLAAKYLHESSCRHGIYLVGYFNCPAWTTSDKRNAKCAKYADINSVQDFFEKQAIELSQGGLMVRAVIVDASLPLHITGKNGGVTKPKAKPKASTKIKAKSKLKTKTTPKAKPRQSVKPRKTLKKR